MFLSVPLANPLFLSFIRVITILPLTALKRRNPVVWARGLVWIKTLACGAGDPGFKSQRARQYFGYLLRSDLA